MCPSQEVEAVRPTLLVVDDEAVIAHVVRQAFAQAGWSVTDAGDGTKAAELLQTGRFDAALVDKNLPGVDGVRLCAIARERSPGMGIVLMTAYATRESAAELLRVGIDDYVEKPFDLETLTDRVQRAVARRKKLTEAARAVEAVRARRATIRRVEMADPSEENRKAVEAALKGLGVEVHSSDTAGATAAGADALLLSARLVDAALADRVAAAREARPDLKVLVLADRRSLEDDIAAIRVGARALVTLPMPPEELAEALANGLGLAAAKP